MTTQINVTVGGVELPAQARRGQEGNRWRLEQTEQQRQTTAQQQAAQAQQAAEAVTGTPSGRAPGYGYRPDELAASRRGGVGFVVIISYALFGYENHTELFVSTPVTGTFQRQTGVMVIPTQFTEEDQEIQLTQGLQAAATKIQPVAQVYSQRGLTAEQFLATVGGAAVSEWIRTHTCWPEWQTNRTVLWNAAHRLEIGQGVTAGNAQAMTYRLALRQVMGDTPAIVRVLTGVINLQDFAVETPLFNYGISPELNEEGGYLPGQVLVIDTSGNYDQERWGPNLFDREKWIDPARLAADEYVYYQGENYSCEFTP